MCVETTECTADLRGWNGVRRISIIVNASITLGTGLIACTLFQMVPAAQPTNVS